MIKLIPKAKKGSKQSANQMERDLIELYGAENYARVGAQLKRVYEASNGELAAKAEAQRQAKAAAMGQGVVIPAANSAMPTTVTPRAAATPVVEFGPLETQGGDLNELADEGVLNDGVVYGTGEKSGKTYKATTKTKKEVKPEYQQYVRSDGSFDESQYRLDKNKPAFEAYQAKKAEEDEQNRMYSNLMWAAANPNAGVVYDGTPESLNQIAIRRQQLTSPRRLWSRAAMDERYAADKERIEDTANAVGSLVYIAPAAITSPVAFAGGIAGSMLGGMAEEKMVNNGMIDRRYYLGEIFRLSPEEIEAKMAAGGDPLTGFMALTPGEALGGMIGGGAADYITGMSPKNLATNLKAGYRNTFKGGRSAVKADGTPKNDKMFKLSMKQHEPDMTWEIEDVPRMRMDSRSLGNTANYGGALPEWGFGVRPTTRNPTTPMYFRETNAPVGELFYEKPYLWNYTPQAGGMQGPPAPQFTPSPIFHLQEQMNVADPWVKWYSWQEEGTSPYWPGDTNSTYPAGNYLIDRSGTIGDPGVLRTRYGNSDRYVAPALTTRQRTWKNNPRVVTTLDGSLPAGTVYSDTEMIE